MLKAYLSAFPDVRVEADEKKGRYLCAKRAFDRDAVVFREVPAVLASDLVDACPVCDPIRKERHSLSDCKECGESAPFARFVPLLKALPDVAKQSGQTIPNLRLLVRCMEAALAVSSGSEQKASSTQQKVLSVFELQSEQAGSDASCLAFNRNILAAGKLVHGFLSKDVQQVTIPGSKDLTFSAERLAALLGIFQLNGHAVDAVAGKGISPAIAMLEHSCEPNCRFASAVDAKSQTMTMVLRALRPIAKDEPLSICYYSRNVPTAIRRQHLQTEYGFLCQCPVCPRGAGEDFSTWECTECSAKLSEAEAKRCLELEQIEQKKQDAGSARVRSLLSSRSRDDDDDADGGSGSGQGAGAGAAGAQARRKMALHDFHYLLS